MPVESALRSGEPAGFDLIETMRYEPGVGILRLDRHLARLYRSAAELGFRCDPARIGETLAAALGVAHDIRRVRLLLSQDGAVTASTQSFALLPENAVWTLRVARTRLCSSDALLRHKTSSREAYVRARSEYTFKQANEVFLLNERGELCEGTITSLFANIGDGILLTPALACGLLPGILRGELLEHGEAREAVLTVHHLRSAKALYVGNALRGLISARLLEIDH